MKSRGKRGTHRLSSVLQLFYSRRAAAGATKLLFVLSVHPTNVNFLLLNQKKVCASSIQTHSHLKRIHFHFMKKYTTGAESMCKAIHRCRTDMEKWETFFHYTPFESERINMVEWIGHCHFVNAVFVFYNFALLFFLNKIYIEPKKFILQLMSPSGNRDYVIVIILRRIKDLGFVSVCSSEWCCTAKTSKSTQCNNLLWQIKTQRWGTHTFNIKYEYWKFNISTVLSVIIFLMGYRNGTHTSCL